MRFFKGLACATILLALSAEAYATDPTVTISSNGTVNADSQPAVLLVSNGASISSGVYTLLTFETVTYDHQNMHISSGTTITIPSGGAGMYFVSCGVRVQANASGFRLIDVRRGVTAGVVMAEMTNNTTALDSIFQATKILSLSDGDNLTCYLYHNSDAGSLSTNAVGLLTYFQAVKLP